MKIQKTDDALPLRQSGAAGTSRGRDTVGAGGAARSGGTGGAILDLSDLLDRIREARDRLLAQDGVRPERLEEAQRKLESGEISTAGEIERLAAGLLKARDIAGLEIDQRRRQ